MLKKFLGLLALIIALNFSVTSAALQPVTDKAGLLTKQEINQLNDKIKDIQHAHKIKIGVIFVKSLGGQDIVTASNNLLDENFANSVNGSILLLIDMDSRKFEMATRGNMTQSITDSDGIPFLKKKFTASLSAGDYSGAANEFVDGVDKLITYYEQNGTAYGTQDTGGFNPMAAVAAIVTALLCGVSIRSWLIGSMSNIRHAMEATDYLKRNTVHFTEQRDMFLFKNVKRRPKSSGGRSGSGGGSHGSGHGGGGGSF